MKVVIDTNGLLRSIPRDGSYRWLYDAFADRQFIWVVSTEILLEYAEMTSYYYSSVAAELVTSLLLAAPNHLRQEPYFHFGQVSADPDDNKFVDCAIAAGADWLVSDDHHILNLLRETNRFPPLPICSFEEFKKILNR
ncbi:putative toxin-antitoxin system toxin component, PIN family [Spirosoma sp. BT702]|uniref:Toxin-antitoxin system toxin component, PIN family n=2 Tax=Spirosoma TaxID=107 RepID=A0A927AVG3_9BACT|nr:MULTISPECIES: putative toxin-antitoxin system toxin component, PIN family [Spirosoma]MBD2705170.1 putative toxin-antitoxin system toxin component, PIN family [Spirosoma profusum]QHW00285.1 putative toxin-antitoxin system toxin component, PIN family [Spirosoma endbachense]